jgi:isocitrate/isopropylmalate dehydrogenase
LYLSFSAVPDFNHFRLQSRNKEAKMIPKPKVLEVGLAIGQGTCPELADVLAKTLKQLARLFNVQVRVHRSSRIYHSYHSLLSTGHDLRHIRNETAQDAAHYEDFCKKQAAQGLKVIFRTAFTAQSLYLVRQHLEAVKVEFFHKQSVDILLIRDQAQGFYTGSNTYGVDALAVSRECQFDKAIFGRIVLYALLRARESWGEDTNIDSLTMVYKHHLFDGVFDVWAQEWSQRHGLHIQFIQPDTMNRNILAFGVQGRQLIIAGNEYADIMEVLFLDMFDQGVQETSYSENVYLAPATSQLVEYQTVHGSADDLTGQGIVNPSATLKAAATILERHGRCKGIESAMDHTIETLAQQRICTPDRGGTTTTAAYVSTILDCLVNLHNQSATFPLTPQLSFRSHME